MGAEIYLIWLSAAVFAAAVVFVLARRSGGKEQSPAAEETERSPVPVEGSNAHAGMHKGVKYWVYLENDAARVEIETGEEKGGPFVSDSREGRARLPGDARDSDVRELIRLGAFRVEATEVEDLLAAHFEARTLNLNAGTRFGVMLDRHALDRIVELLTAVREKGLGGPAR